MNQGEAALERLLPPPKNPAQSQEDLLALTPAQKPPLIRYWRRCPTQERRYYAIWPLTYLGGDDVRELFIASLYQDWKEMDWERDHYSMVQMLRAIGFLAQTDDRAFGYLTNATSSEAWKHVTVRGWEKGSELARREDLALECVVALAHSGRAEVGLMLRGWRARPPSWVRPELGYGLRGILYEAMIEWQVVRRMGVESYRRKMRTPERGEEAVAWQLSPEGLDWLKYLDAPGISNQPVERLKDVFRDMQGLRPQRRAIE